MYAIAKREFLTLFKSFKSVAIVLLFCIVAFSISNFVKNNPGLMFGEESNPYVSGIRFLVTVLGFLFVLTLSHDTINREVESQTIRFVVTKVPKTSIVFGKYLGILLFWAVCLACSFIVIFLSIGQLYVLEYIRLIVFISFAVGVNMLLSTIIPKGSYSIFASLLCGLLLPAAGMWSVFTENQASQLIKYATPYYYLIESNWKSYFPFVISILFVYVAIFIFRRKDL
ncbi:hypothetical protein PAALTS15_27866 [Paenibacillus alvei TS-15]|jgi:ABC-2 type transport system permease protein|uniref:ABC transporter permease n=1 Tax=Paenibacillus alvei TS-15 TaxID=1117108 RepID=S9TZD1_PAEAL|nr:hypothetical protein PAALTS15_27866 [Paenibacillus alvei TS-15]